MVTAAAPGKESCDKPRQHIKKQRDITLPARIRIVQAVVFPVVMCESESWTLKKTERPWFGAFRLWCWRRLLSLWTAGRLNQSILKEINPEYSLEGLMLKLQYFGRLMWKTHWKRPWCWEKMELRRRREWQRKRWLDNITKSMEVRLSKLWEIVKDREASCAPVHGVTKTLTWLSDWTTTKGWLHSIH